jgi:hypothetical protein
MTTSFITLDWLKKTTMQAPAAIPRCRRTGMARSTETEARTEGVLGQNGRRSLSCRTQHFEMKVARLTSRWSPSLRQAAARRSSAAVRQTDHEGPFVAALSRTANQRQQAFFFPATDFLGTGAN